MASIINATTTNGVAVQGDNSGSLQLQTNNGTTAVTIDTSQNVGIGTTSPADKLDVARNSGANSTGGLTLTNTSTSGYGSAVNWNLALNSVAGINGRMYCEAASSTSSFMAWQTTSGGTLAERMRIASGGDVLIGTTTSSGKFTVNQTDTGTRTISASSPASYAATVFRSDSAATSGTGWYHLYGSSSSGTVNNIFIYGNGNIQNANNSYGAISDIKLKENIVDATPKLDKLMQVKVRNYNLKGEYEQHKQIGVIAQELETIFPSLIEETQDRGENDELLGTTTKSVKYSVFVPILIKAIQELKAELDATKAEVAALKGVA